MFHPFSSHVNYHRVGQLEGQLGLGHAASPSVDVKAKLLGAAATRWRLNCPGKTKGSTSRVRYKHGIRKLQFFMGPKSWSNMVQPSQAKLEKSSAKQSGSKIKHVKPIRVGVRAQKGLRAPDTWLADQNYSRGDHTWPYCTIQHQIERHMHKCMQCTNARTLW